MLVQSLQWLLHIDMVLHERAGSEKYFTNKTFNNNYTAGKDWWYAFFIQAPLFTRIFAISLWFFLSRFMTLSSRNQYFMKIYGSFVVRAVEL